MTETEETIPNEIQKGAEMPNESETATFKDTKKAIDEFFADEPGVLEKLPTGQAIYYR